MTLILRALASRKPQSWTLVGAILLSFAAGAFMAALLTRVNPVEADANRVFELRVYHTVPGKLPVMESRFRDTTSKLLAKHNLSVLGYWTGGNASSSEAVFVFLLAHQDLEAAHKNWEAMGADPEFQQVIKAEQQEKTLEKADIILMRPTDFSPME